MSQGPMRHLQLYKGCYRLRRPIPKHLQPFLKRGAYLTCKLRQPGEPPLRAKPEAERRAILAGPKLQEILDRAQARYDALDGPLENLRREVPEEGPPYQLSDPNDPTSPVIGRIEMRDRMVKRLPGEKIGTAYRWRPDSNGDPVLEPAPAEPAPATPPAPVKSDPKPDPTVSYNRMIAEWLALPQKNGRAHAPGAGRSVSPMVKQFRDWLAANGHPADDMALVLFPMADDYIKGRLGEINAALTADGDHEAYRGRSRPCAII